MKNNKIIWQKWMDPFGEDDVSDLLAKIEEDDFDTYKDKDDDTKEEKPHIPKGVKVMATPMGIIPLSENTASGKIFNFWLGHTNFDITHDIGSIIESCEGVECLDIFTRYRFRIAIGKAFTDSEVMASIQDHVYNHLKDHDI